MNEKDEKALRTLGFQPGTIRNLDPDGLAIHRVILDHDELPCGCAVYNGLRVIGWTITRTAWWFKCNRKVCGQDMFFRLKGYKISREEFEKECLQAGDFISRQRKLPL